MPRELPDSPPDEWWGDEPEPVPQDREPRDDDPDDPDLRDWQDGGVEW